jgi:hypothetical protein
MNKSWTFDEFKVNVLRQLGLNTKNTTVDRITLVKAPKPSKYDENNDE